MPFFVVISKSASSDFPEEEEIRPQKRAPDSTAINHYQLAAFSISILVAGPKENNPRQDFASFSIIPMSRPQVLILRKGTRVLSL